MKKAFTILELMVVMAVIGVLLSIVVTVTGSQIKQSRGKRRQSMAIVLREGINTYHARNGKWPGQLESCADNGTSTTLKGSAADNVFREVVKGSIGAGKNPYLSPSSLFVAPSGVSDNKTFGVDFSAARTGYGKAERKIGVSEMSFGFQHPDTGHFRRYRIVYNAASDSVDVTWVSDDTLHGDGD